MICFFWLLNYKVQLYTCIHFFGGKSCDVFAMHLFFKMFAVLHDFKLIFDVVLEKLQVCAFNAVVTFWVHRVKATFCVLKLDKFIEIVETNGASTGHEKMSFKTSYRKDVGILSILCCLWYIFASKIFVEFKVDFKQYRWC